MKRTLFRALSLGALFFCAQAMAQTPSLELVGSITTGTNNYTTGADTYALNMALTGTASSYIDMRSQYGILVALTSSAKPATVWIEWNNVTYTATTWLPNGTLISGTHQNIRKNGKYLRFRVADTGWPGSTTSLWYSMLDAPTAPPPSSTPAPITGTVLSNQGASNSGDAWYLRDTRTANAVEDISGTARRLETGLTAGSYALKSSPNAGTQASPIFVNSGGFNFLSATVVASGLTPNADTVTSLTWAASTTTGPLFIDLNCSGATGLGFLITNAAATPAGFVGNAALFGYQPCGQISQVPLEVNAANTPHLHAVAVTLSNTSAALGIVTKQRP